MRPTLPLIIILITGLMSGCVLDPLSLISDPIMLAVEASSSEPSGEEILARMEAENLKKYTAQVRALTCPELTAHYHEFREYLLSSPPNGPIHAEVREQVIAEMGCIVPTPLTEGNPALAKSATATSAESVAASAPTAKAAELITPSMQQTSASSSLGATLAMPPPLSPPSLAFCYHYVTNNGYKTNPDVLSSIFEDKTVNASAKNLFSELKLFSQKVAAQQPGVWHELNYRLENCAPSVGVCHASAQPLFGDNQAIMLRCFSSELEAKAARSYDQKEDPTATTIPAR